MLQLYRKVSLSQPSLKQRITPVGFTKRTPWRFLTSWVQGLLKSKCPKTIHCHLNPLYPEVLLWYAWFTTLIFTTALVIIGNKKGFIQQMHTWDKFLLLCVGVLLKGGKNPAWLNSKCIIHSSVLIFKEPQDTKLCWIDFDILSGKSEHLILFSVVKTLHWLHGYRAIFNLCMLP